MRYDYTLKASFDCQTCKYLSIHAYHALHASSNDRCVAVAIVVSLSYA